MQRLRVGRRTFEKLVLPGSIGDDVVRILHLHARFVLLRIVAHEIFHLGLGMTRLCKAFPLELHMLVHDGIVRRSGFHGRWSVIHVGGLREFGADGARAADEFEGVDHAFLFVFQRGFVAFLHGDGFWVADGVEIDLRRWISQIVDVATHVDFDVLDEALGGIQVESRGFPEDLQ